MTNEQAPNSTGPALTDLQRTRIEYARRDLEYARSEDLGQLQADGLILVVERLRGRLADALLVIDEITHG
jgi:hypothetical protein